jgi:hypothetical protein
MKKSAAARASGSLVILLGLLGCTPGASGIDVHPDDLQHPLSVLPGSGLSGVDQPAGTRDGDTWDAMFGMFMPCIAQGEGPVEITGVDWSSSPGLEPLSVEVYVRTFVVGDEDSLGRLYGTPEDFRSKSIEPFSEKFTGMTVGKPCHKEGDPPVSGSVDEVIFSVKGKSSGAHLRGIQFTYATPDRKEHVVENDWDFYLCGPGVPEEIGC